jgi:hypothetical protein
VSRILLSRLALATTATIGALALMACDTPDAIAKYCSSAVSTLTAGSTIFDDMGASCLREVNLRRKLASFEAPVTTDDSCAQVAKEAAGAKAATNVLAQYFAALNALASFDTAKVGTDAKGLVDQASGVAKLSDSAKGALGQLGQFLASTTTGAYQRRQLERDLPVVSTNVAHVIDGLATVVQRDYGLLLRGEAQKLSDQYREFAQDQGRRMPLTVDTQLSLYARWKSDRDAIDARQIAADSFVMGLQAISNGLANLAANANKLTAKELPGLLEPYVTELQTLIPAIQKAL